MANIDIHNSVTTLLKSILNWTSESPAAGVVSCAQVYAKEVPKSGDVSYIQ